MRKLILGLLIFITILFVGFYSIGALSSEHYQGQVEAKFNAHPDSVWQLLENFEQLQKQRKEITKIEIIERDSLNVLSWKQYTDMDGYILFHKNLNPDKKIMVVTMKESSFGMQGYWTYTVLPKPTGCLVRIEENSTTTDLFVRSALSIAGRDANLKQEIKLIQDGIQ